jgi:hypothetical protein
MKITCQRILESYAKVQKRLVERRKEYAMMDPVHKIRQTILITHQDYVQVQDIKGLCLPEEWNLHVKAKYQLYTSLDCDATNPVDISWALMININHLKEYDTAIQEALRIEPWIVNTIEVPNTKTNTKGHLISGRLSGANDGPMLGTSWGLQQGWTRLEKYVPVPDTFGSEYIGALAFNRTHAIANCQVFYDDEWTPKVKKMNSSWKGFDVIVVRIRTRGNIPANTPFIAHNTFPNKV